VLLAALARAVQPVTDPDYFWHLRVGRWIIDHRAIPHTDLFTYTVSDHRFVAHEWLSEVAMAALTGLAGSPHGPGPAAAPETWAVALLFGVVTWAAFVLLLVTPRDAGWLFRGLAVFLGLLAAAPILGPRTQMLTFCFSALVLYVLRRWREDPPRGSGSSGTPDGRHRRLWVLPPLFVLWANTHAGFAFGLGLLAVYLAGEALERWWARPAQASRPSLKPLAAVCGACLAAVAVNPNFLAIYPYALETQASPAQQQLIVEWASPNFHLPELRAFEVMLVLLALLLALARRRPRATDLLLALLGVGLALQSVRHVALFVVLATPLLAEAAQAVWEARPDGWKVREPPRRRVLGLANLALLALVAAVVGLYSLGNLRGGPAQLRRDFPVAALDAVAADPPPGHLLDLYEWGGYAVYRLWPGRQVFIYGDAAVMGDDFLRQYQAISDIHPDYRAVIDRYQVEWVLFGTNQPLTVLLSASPEWVVLHQDGVATVLVRRDASTSAYLLAHGRG
jgi:hypothetical protein